MKITLKNRLKFPLLFAAALTTLSGCYDTRQEGIIGDAENILFTSNGALLVTGGKSIYQKLSHDAPPEPLNPAGIQCNFTGIAEYNGWVFTTCVELRFFIFKNNHLFAARLPATPYERMDFQLLYATNDRNDPIDQIFLPNGIAFTSNGDLLVADYNLATTSSVARLEIAFPDPSDHTGKPVVAPAKPNTTSFV
ncbi:MAG: hypothetical protein LAT63_05910 [Marinobacter sp.]|nr:hypothetical protein [Marinobacter sp.]